MADSAAPSSQEPTPSQPPPDQQVDQQVDQQSLLTQKAAQASHLYAHKSYEAAAEVYAEAAELQASLNGELALENADLLYAYGRCLYHVAVSKSDVLGGKVAGEKTTHSKDDAKKRGVKRKKGGEANGTATVEGQQHAADKLQDQAESTNTPYFQIEGDDADWSSGSEDDEDIDEEQVGEEAEATEQDANGTDDPDGTAADEEDDFATAYEILDIARVLLSRKLEAAEPDARAIKECLADTHDLQSEISLESERFEAAVSDARASLVLKQELYPQDSNYVAEAHFKLSLALEFASVTQVKDDAAAGSSVAETSLADRNAGVAGVDEEMRKEAASQMEASIASTRMRLEREKAALATMDAGTDERRAKEGEVVDVTGMIEEMEQRLADLKQPAISVQGLGMGDDAEDPVKGLLGSILGESKATRAAAIEEATRGANDLSGLVKRKGKSTTEAATGSSSSASDGAGVVANGNGNGNGNGKRTAAVMSGANGDGNAPHTKKTKVEEAPEL